MAFSIIGAAGNLVKSGSAFESKRVFLGSSLAKFESEPDYPQSLDENSFFDLASLTKVLVTAPLLWEWSEKVGRDRLYEPVIHLSPELASVFKEGPFASITLKNLLEHQSGLRAHDLPWGNLRFPDLKRARLWEIFLDFLKKEECQKIGETLYSDLGFLTLGFFLESYYKKSLKEIFEVSHLKDSASYFEWGLSSRLGKWALCFPTEARHPKGEVNDDKAASLCGVAPHSGLFGSVVSLERWLCVLAEQLESHPLFKEFSRPRAQDANQRFFWGWDQPSYADPDSQAGFPAPPATLGHLGYTGTALWWNPATLQYGILLSNRVYPAHSAQSQSAIKKIRSSFFSALWQSSKSKDTLNLAWENIKQISAGHT